MNSVVVKVVIVKMAYRPFPLTLPASMQIHWNERKRLHKTEFKSHRIALEH